MRGKHEGARCCYVGPPDHCASCKMTRLSPAPHLTPSSLGVGHMYSRGWTKVIGDIMEANGRVGGFQFHMCELRSTTGTLSSGLDERTDGRMDERI